MQPQPRLPVAEADVPPETPFEKAADRPPTSKTLYVMAKLYAGQGKDAEAEQLLQQVLNENPRFVPAFCELAEARMRQQRVPDAIRTLEAGLNVAPAEPVLLNNLGMCRVLQGDYEPALQAFLAAVAARPTTRATA